MTAPAAPPRERPGAVISRGGIGESRLRPDGVPKVTGDFAYSSDMWMDQMLWGVTLRSPHPRARIVRLLRTYASLSPDAARDVYARLFGLLRTWSVGTDRESFYEVAFVLKQTLAAEGSRARTPELGAHLADLLHWLKDTIELPRDPRARISAANLTSLLLSVAVAVCTTEEERSGVASLLPEAMARHRVAAPASMRPLSLTPPSIPPPAPLPGAKDAASSRKRRASAVRQNLSPTGSPTLPAKTPKKPRKSKGSAKVPDPSNERKH